MGIPSVDGPVLLAYHQSHGTERTIDLVSSVSTDTVLWRNRDELIAYIQLANSGAKAPYRVPKLAILDLLAPSGGLEVLHALKAGRRTRDVPAVVIAQGRDEAEFLQEYVTQGIDVIERPLTSKKLVHLASRLGLGVH